MGIRGKLQGASLSTYEITRGNLLDLTLTTRNFYDYDKIEIEQQAKSIKSPSRSKDKTNIRREVKSRDLKGKS